MRDFWPHEARRVKKAYPQFNLRDRLPRPDLDPEDAARCGTLVRMWRGSVQPFSPSLDREEFLAILLDLYDDIEVMVAGGSIRHDSTRCHRPSHTPDHGLIPEHDVTATYEIEVAYAVPPARPIVRGLKPRLTTQKYPDMPHPIVPLNALCVSYAPRDAWNLYGDGALLYLDWAAIYLAKHTLWLEVFQRKGRADWPGEGVGPHYDPAEELKVSPVTECSCNSGRQYRDCHRALDAENAARKLKGQALLQRRMDIEFYRDLR
jgi:hypothetical protein